MKNQKNAKLFSTLLRELLIKARHQKGITQRELGILVGKSIVHIGKIEAGLAKPSLELLDDLMQILDVSLPELFPLYEDAERNERVGVILSQLRHLPMSDIEVVQNLVQILGKRST
jgi:transcriptional regulator with XRE-family HTH domain